MRFPNKLNWASKDIKRDAVRAFGPFVKFIAKQFSRRFKGQLEFEDFVQAGNIGLLDAVTKYDPDKGVEFKTYAEVRIRGEMLDEHRRSQEKTLLPAGIKTVSQRISSDSTMTKEDRIAISRFVLENSICPLTKLIEKRRIEDLSSAISELSQKAQKVVYLYFYTDMNLKEIGAHMGFTESRAHQTLNEAFVRLRGKSKLKKHMEK